MTSRQALTPNVRNVNLSACDVVVVVVVILTLPCIIKPVVTGQAPVSLELRNTTGKKHKQIEGGTRKYHS